VLPHRILREPALSARRLPYAPGLDGLRALAVLAVVLYHAQPAWLPGGFLGVEVFFVISGYLITALLLAEWQQRNHIDLRLFWLRRARRLLPALYLLLLVTLVVATFFLPGQLARLRGDALAAFGYVTNWYLVFGHQSYFVTMGRPSLLQHLWSLAVEEQFYLVWPLLCMALLRWCRRLITPLILAAAAASAAWMAFLYRPGIDPSRLYYGTDTRAAGLLIGAALATVWSMRQPGKWGPSRSALLIDGAGLSALAGLGVLCLRLGEYQPFLYRGGFLLIALLTAVVIAATVQPAGKPGQQLLGCRPLRWVGLRSYSIYLWHWPVLMLTRPHLDLPLGEPALLPLQLALTVALAALSYRYVETPVRTGVLAQVWHTMRETLRTRAEYVHLGWLTALGLVLGGCVTVGGVVVLARPPAAPAYLAVSAIHSTAVAKAGVPLAPGEPVASIASVDSPSDTRGPVRQPVRPAAWESTQRVSAVGDSVMLGSSQALLDALPQLDIDAEVGRQPQAAVAPTRARRTAGLLGGIVIVHLGDNGPITASELDDLLATIGADRRVMVVNVRVPRAWEVPNNEALRRTVKQHPNARLVDWYGVSAGHTEFFRDDGVHLVPAGARVYVSLLTVRVCTEQLVALFTGK